MKFASFILDKTYQPIIMYHYFNSSGLLGVFLTFFSYIDNIIIDMEKHVYND